jgi:hypothetical protein
MGYLMNPVRVSPLWAGIHGQVVLEVKSLIRIAPVGRDSWVVDNGIAEEQNGERTDL